MSTLIVVERVMRDTKIPMSVRNIVEAAGEDLPTRSKTPETVVARDLAMSIKRLGDESPFVRTAPGRYTMRVFLEEGLVAMGDTGDAVRAQDSSSEVPLCAPTPEQSTLVLSKALDEHRQGARSVTPNSQQHSSLIADTTVGSHSVS